SNNTATGTAALADNSTGHHNVANGFWALALNSGSFNTAIGGGARLPNGSVIGTLFNNTTGSRNTATGCQVLVRNQTGNGNTAEGFQALVNNTGSFNIAV